MQKQGVEFFKQILAGRPVPSRVYVLSSKHEDITMKIVTIEEQINLLKNSHFSLYGKWRNQVFISNEVKSLGSDYQVLCFANYVEYKIIGLLQSIDNHWRHCITIENCPNDNNKGEMHIYQGTNRLLICSIILNYNNLPKLGSKLYLDLRCIDDKKDTYFLSTANET